jgi:hypothetical protein
MPIKPTAAIIVRTRECPTIFVCQDGLDMGMQS